MTKAVKRGGSLDFGGKGDLRRAKVIREKDRKEKQLLK